MAAGPDITTARQFRRVIAAVTAASLLLIAVALLWLASGIHGLKSEARYRDCLARVDTSYPAVAVSGFQANKTATGPLKVSFAAQRAAAAKRCKAP